MGNVLITRCHDIVRVPAGMHACTRVKVVGCRLLGRGGAERLVEEHHLPQAGTAPSATAGGTFPRSSARVLDVARPGFAGGPTWGWRERERADPRLAIVCGAVCGPLRVGFSRVVLAPEK